MKKMILAAALLLAVFSAHAGNDGCNNRCGEETGGATANGGNATGGSGYGGDSAAVGMGVGVGMGGSGGQGGAGGRGGDGGSAVALGGSGGSVSGSGNSSNLNSNKAEGGSAYQGQSQGQKQSNVGVNTSQNVLGQSTDASSQNDNRSMGNTTTVGGDTTLVERNAPPVFLGAITPTSCGGSFQAGGSDRNGAGAFGLSWVGRECATRLIGDRFQQLGMVDVACEVYKSTKAFRKAAKRNPKLAAVDCSVKPVTAPVSPSVSFTEPRIPRG